jgi:hypothetical protein
MFSLKKSPKFWATSAIFKNTVQCKQSPIGRKFAQSGHPAPVSLQKTGSMNAFFVCTAHEQIMAVRPM